MAKVTALVVDDEADIRELLKVTLGRMQIKVIDAENFHAAQGALAAQPIQFCLTDMRLPDGDGLALVHHIQSHFPGLPVAVTTAFGNMELAVNALKAGAFDFVAKPIDLKILRDLVNTALRLVDHSAHIPDLTSRLIGQSQAIKDLEAKIQKLALSQAPVLISGPSGVGKELVARMIHEQGPWADQPFIPVNCGAIPGELMESEFFGHRRGSFTGAVSDKQGLFQAAAGGTLFLDEVAELPLHMQVKLLRAIQERSIRRIGDLQEEPIEVRILSATHQDLPMRVQAGEFRQDFFYRINVIELPVPSLAERPEDIELLAAHFLQQLAKLSQQRLVHLSPTALTALQAYEFPGNIRELENILERAYTLCEGRTIDVVDLALPSQKKTETTTLGDSLDHYLGDVERQKIIKALEQTRWNKTQAAKLLGITLRALRYRLEKLNLE